MGVKDVVEVLAKALADKPDEVRVVETQHKATTLVEVYVKAGLGASAKRAAEAAEKLDPKNAKLLELLKKIGKA